MTDSKVCFSLSKEGYVLNYLTTEAVTEPFIAPHTDKNQLKFEADMRKIFAKPISQVPPSGTIGEKSSLGAEWKFYAKNRNTYIDFSTFYFTLTSVNIHAITQLVSDRAKAVRARIWSYCTVDMWLNGTHCANIKDPVYKPISHLDITLELREGINDIFVSLQNFGVRDTRNMFSLQLFDTDGVCVTLPIESDTLTKLKEAENWLCDLRCDKTKLVSKKQPSFPVTVKLDEDEYVWNEGCSYGVAGKRNVAVSFDVCSQQFMRRFDILQNEKLVFNKDNSSQSRKNAVLTKIANTPFTPDWSILFAFLSKYYINQTISDEDYKLIDNALEYVAIRKDCSDFALMGLLYIYKLLPISDEYKKKIHDVALDYRYWMDEEGADAMCFWSENHALTFFVCQTLAGSIWPEEFFHRSGKRGIDLYKKGMNRINQWFDVIEHEGFEEFLAGGYLLVTTAPLFVLYDFSTDEVIKARAKNTLDRIMREAALQCFDGIHMAPMGRIYRGALTPYDSALQSLLYAIDENCAQAYSGWLIYFYYSSYKMPDDLTDLMRNNANVTFDSGRASITTKKTKNYMLTSVASPRRTPLPEEKYTDTEYYATKVMNEWFHGTSLFVPGEYGYQQHLWYAAISNRCYTFVNHPGTEKDFGGMRPDYWYGNGVFPALMQDNNTLYCYYNIPDDHPTKFTHMYWPSFAMEEEVKRDGFMFARVGDSYMGMWCSKPLELNNDDAVMDCDYRAYGDTCAWVVRCSDKNESGSFEAFIDEFMGISLTEENVKNIIGV
ncbi:MAG: hypothetical protein E7410_02620 [Ruminococcaceae bacterium]|nr:hypothetical protein [Oscillospiraceae bacterium]